MMKGRDLFTHICLSQEDYNVWAHLAEMIVLLNISSKILIDQEICWSEVKWSHAVSNSEGKLCQTTHEYYEESFFNSKDDFMHKNLISIDVRLEDSVLSLKREDKHLFLDFIKKMLQWLSKDRKTVKKLLEDSWLQKKST